MKKTVIALMAGLVLSAGFLAAPAEAHCGYGGWRGAVNRLSHRWLGTTPFYNTAASYNPYYGVNYGAYNPYYANPYTPYYGGGVINTLMRIL